MVPMEAWSSYGLMLLKSHSSLLLEPLDYSDYPCLAPMLSGESPSFELASPCSPHNVGTETRFTSCPQHDAWGDAL
jgi:hypothetical protein